VDVAGFTGALLPARLRARPARGEVNAINLETRSPLMNSQPVEPQAASAPAYDLGGGDHDQPYTWGRPPSTYMTYRQAVRLTILRSKLEDVRMQRVGSAAGA
jgi:hypothetical protein